MLQFSSIWVLVYASVVMALLLAVHPRRLSQAKRFVLLIGLPCIFFINSIAMGRLDLHTFGKFYPLIGQLPIFLVFLTVSGRGFLKTFFVLLTTMFLTFPYSFVNLLLGTWLQSSNVLVGIIMILTSAMLVLAIWRFIAPNFVYMMNHLQSSDIVKFCAIPIFYSVLTYAIGKYAGGIALVPIRCFLFFNTLVVYLLLMNILKRTRDMQLLQNEKYMLALLMESSRKNIDELRASQNQTVLYRHDIRHHLTLISRLAEDGGIDKVKGYLNKVQTDLDALTPIRFCENETVNLILSSFADKAQKGGVSFLVDAKLPESLALPETELCAVLSNGLENAIAAAALVDKGDRSVWVNCRLDENKLLIFIQNDCMGKVTFVNGLPKADQKGHGFGTKSMAAIAEKRNGHFACETEDGKFTVRMVLPMDK